MSEDTVYAVASGKGGVGKTTATVNVGTAIAGMDNEVAVVDVDLGMANLARFVDLEPADATLHDVLAGTATIDDAAYEIAAGIVVIPSGDELSSYADVDASKLRTVVATLRAEFDYVILDVGAGISHETVLPLGLADGVITVATPDPAAIANVEKTIDLVDRTDGRTAGLVVNRVRSDDEQSPQLIADELDVRLLGAVPEDDAVRKSLFAGVPLVVQFPESPASSAYWQVAAALAEDRDRQRAVASTSEPTADSPTTEERSASMDEGPSPSDTEGQATDAAETPSSPDPTPADEPTTASSDHTPDDSAPVIDLDAAPESVRDDDPSAEDSPAEDGSVEDSPAEDGSTVDSPADGTEPVSQDAPQPDASSPSQPDDQVSSTPRGTEPGATEGDSTQTTADDSAQPTADAGSRSGALSDAISEAETTDAKRRERTGQERSARSAPDDPRSIPDEAIPFRGGTRPSSSTAETNAEPGDSAADPTIEDDPERSVEDESDDGDEDEPETSDRRGGLFSRFFS